MNATNSAMRIFVMISLGVGLTTWGQDWKQFRGTDVSGVLGKPALPAMLEADKSISWKVQLPGEGLSSPIVVGDRVFVSCSSGVKQDRLHVRCHAAESGELIWERQFWATGRTMCHDKTAVAAPTPASDGNRIYVLFSSNDLVCLDLEGRLQWLRGLTADYPNASNSLGMASSPVVVGNTLVVQSEDDSESFAVGIDADTGRNRWRLDRPKAANWTSPVIMDDAVTGDSLVVLQSSRGVTGIRPETGDIVWNYSDGASTIPSSVVAGSLLLVPSHGITALRPQSTDSEPEQLWRSSRLRPATPSPVVLGGKLFTVNQAGVVTCGSLEDGDRIWQLRLKGPFSGTPVGWGKFLYFVNEAGLLQVVDTEAEEGEIVSQLDLGEMILCTPALAEGALYVRSDRHLWRIGE